LDPHGRGMLAVRCLAGVAVALAFGYASSAVPVCAEAAVAPLPELIAQCAVCHGEEGNSRTEGVPSLAGQPAAYLERQLRLFRDGRRPSPIMQPITAELSDAQASALAEHYTRLRLRSEPSRADPDLMRQGYALSVNRVCGGCHRTESGGHELIPRLEGQREDYLRASLVAYRNRVRIGPEGVMVAAADHMSDKHIRALAHFFAHRP